MTAWQSIFDGGACTVSVYDTYGQTELWSGELGKGDLSPTFFDTINENACRVSVDADGVVTLASPDNSQTDAAGFSLNVAPQYDVSALQTRMLAMSVPSTGMVSGWANNLRAYQNQGEGTQLSIDTTTGAVTPSEADFAAHADPTLSLFVEGYA